MEAQELIECQEILKKQSSWFSFRQEDITQKLNCLKIFEDKGKPQDIFFLFPLMKKSNDVLRNAAADTIIALLKKINSHAEFYSSLKYANVEKDDLNFFEDIFSPEIYFHILSIASLNTSGYVREEAIKRLAKLQNPDAIRFIIFRLGDWVENVREAAKEAIRNYFKPIFIDEFLQQLPLIEWLLKVERTNLTNIYSEIFQFVFSFDLDEIFYRKINDFEDRTKFIYVRNYLKSNPATKEIFQILSDDKLFLVKIELLKHIEKLDENAQKLFIKKFFKDRSAKVRVYAIYSTKPFRSEFHDDILDSTFDVSASVRELARFVLRGSSVDFANLYRQRLRENENLQGAILGLSEIGTQADLPIFEKYIQKPNVRIKVACLSAINRLNKGIAREYALNLLSNSSAKVRNKCVEILGKTTDYETLERARDIYQSGNIEQKKTILKMFSQIGSWKIVGDFIIALSDKDERIQNLGWMHLEKWCKKQLFTKPSSEDIERINKLYNEFEKTRSEIPYNRKQLWKDLPFYLR